MKHRFYLLFLLLIISLCHRASAQVTLSELVVSSHQVLVNQPNNSIQVYYSVRITRPVNTTHCPIALYAVNAATTTPDQVNNLGASQMGLSNWVSDYNGNESAQLTGTIQLNYILTSYGQKTKIEALHNCMNTADRATSNLVSITFNPATTPAPNPTTVPASIASLSANVVITQAYPVEAVVNPGLIIYGSNLSGVTTCDLTPVAPSVAGLPKVTLPFYPNNNNRIYIPYNIAPGFYKLTLNKTVSGINTVSNAVDFSIRPDPIAPTTYRCLTQGNGQGWICKTQYVPWTTLPADIGGTTCVPEGCNDDVRDVDWQYSYDGINWSNTNNKVSNWYYTPWACWQPVHFRAAVLQRKTNIWNQVYHDFDHNSNEVNIIPYVTIASGVYKLVNRQTNQVLEIGGSGNANLTAGQHANQWPDNGTANQQWTILLTENGMYKLVNRNSGQVLQAETIRSLRGEHVNQWPWRGSGEYGGTNQQWLIHPVYNTGYYFITNAVSGLSLEIGGGSSVYSQAGAHANVWPESNDNSYNQQWQLVPVSAPAATAFTGTYTIQNVNSAKVLTVNNQDAPVTQASSVGIATQQWSITEAGNNAFKITNRFSGKVLEIGGSNPNQGAAAQQWANGNTANQLWSIEQVGSSPVTYRLMNRSSQLYLDMEWASKVDGAPAIQWPWYGSTNQQWILTRVHVNRPANNAPTNETGYSQAEVLAATTPQTANAITKLEVYPNPASTMLYLNMPGLVSELTSVTVNDLRGAIVSSARYIGNGQLDIASLSAGTYILTVSVRNGNKQYHQKFTKQ